MVKVKYCNKAKGIIELPKESKEGFYIHGTLKFKLDNVKKVLKKNWDVVFLIDGMEGSGKSTLGLTCAYYIADGNFTIDNVCESSKDAVDKLKEMPDGSVLMIDEGSLMFSSRETMMKEQRQIVKILNVIRQKRMCLIIIAPSFFNLNKYISVERSRFLLHTYTDKNLNRGNFCFYGERLKPMLYTIGKKFNNSYAKPAPNFRGSFTDFKSPFHEEYIKSKQRTLIEALKVENKRDPRIIKREVIKTFIANGGPKKTNLTKKEIADMFDISVDAIRVYFKQIEEKEKKDS